MDIAVDGGPALTKDRDREFIRVVEWAPFVDSTEDDKESLIKADLPEIKKEDAEISVEDAVILYLWQRGNDFPDGTVTFPQSLGHIFNQPKLFFSQEGRALNREFPSL